MCIYNLPSFFHLHVCSSPLLIPSHNSWPSIVIPQALHLNYWFSIYCLIFKCVVLVWRCAMQGESLQMPWMSIAMECTSFFVYNIIVISKIDYYLLSFKNFNQDFEKSIYMDFRYWFLKEQRKWKELKVETQWQISAPHEKCYGECDFAFEFYICFVWYHFAFVCLFLHHKLIRFHMFIQISCKIRFS